MVGRAVVATLVACALISGGIGAKVGWRAAEQYTDDNFFLLDKGSYDCALGFLYEAKLQEEMLRVCVRYQMKGIQLDGHYNPRHRINNKAQRSRIYREQQTLSRRDEIQW